MSEPVLPWVPCPAVDIQLHAPVSQRFADLPDEIIQRGARLLSAVMEDIPAKAQVLPALVRLRTANRFHAEFLALSKMIDADWKDVTLANISYDLVLSMFGCSTIALPTKNGPIVARNMDWWPENVLAQCSCLVRFHRGNHLAFANAGWPGAVGVVTGLSGRGFCVTLNAVSGPEGINKYGYPVLLHLRRVIEDASGFDEALKMLSTQKLTAPALITLVGSENDQRVVVERTPTRHALRWAEPGKALVTTNDYRLLFKPESQTDGAEIYQTTCQRFDYLVTSFADHDAASQAIEEKLMYVLTDERVIQGITAQHIVMRPAENTVRMFVPRRLITPGTQNR